MTRKKAMTLVLIGVVMVSYSGPVVKAALLEGATPVTVAFVRMLLASLFMLPLAIRGKAFTEIKDATKAIKGQVFLSAACLALHYLTWMTSLNQTSTFASVALVCTQPLFVAGFSALVFHEKIKKAAIPGALVALAGAVLIGVSGLGGGAGGHMGELTALIGAVFIAAHWLFGRGIRRSLKVQSYTISVYVLTALMLLVMIPFAGGFALPGLSFWYVLVLALGCTMLGHALFTAALGTVSANVISFALLFEPVGAMVWAILFFKEIPTPLLALGGAFVLAGLALYLYADMKETVSISG